MNTKNKNACLRRLARIAGQIAGISRMVDSERPCKDTLQQICSVRAAMDQVGILFVAEHLSACVLLVDDEGNQCCELPEDQRSDEIHGTLTRFLRTRGA